MSKELEVKVLNIELEDMEKKLISLGARCIAKEKQVNTIIDGLENNIQNRNDAYLRIREKKSLLDGKEEIIMTYKKNILNENIRENLELDVKIHKNEKQNLIKILSELGYNIVNIGYKDRTSYILDNIRFDLDLWDVKTYPNPYMEIEVENPADLEKAIELLNLNLDDITIDSIVDLKNKL